MAEEPENKQTTTQSEKNTKKKIINKVIEKSNKLNAAKQSLMKAIAHILAPVMSFIIFLVIIIGLVMFLVTMPGMVMEKLKALGKAIAQGFASWFGSDDTQNIDDSVMYETLDYLAEMGYDLKGYGFLTDYIEEESDITSDEKSNISTAEGASAAVIEDGVVKQDDKIVIARSDFIIAYLISDNYVYTIKNDNLTTDHWWTAVGQHFKRFFTGSYNEKYTRGLIAIYKEDGAIGNVGRFYSDKGFLNFDNLSIDASKKTITIKKGLTNNAMTYSLDGWTGRYGMPIDFLISVHLATMMPDLAYDMTKQFDTNVNLVLHEVTGATVTAAFKDGDTYVTYNDIHDNTYGWFSWGINAKEAYKIYASDTYQINSPSGCLGIGNDDNVGIYSVDGGDGVTNKKDDAGISAYNDLMKKIKDLGYTSTNYPTSISSYSELDDNLSDITEEKNENYNPDGIGYDANYTHYEYYKTTTIEFSWLGTATVTDSDGNEKTESCTYSTTLTVSHYDQDSATTYDSNAGLPFSADNPDGEVFYVTYTDITRTWTQTEYDEAIENAKEGKTEEELEGLSDLDLLGLTRCSVYAKANKDEDRGCCSVCLQYIKDIHSVLADVDDSNFDYYIPYIASVTGHWYRDVYFVEESGINFVDYDYEYESMVKERWTLYETDDDTGEYKLYLINKDTGDYATSTSQIKNYSENSSKIKKEIIDKKTYYVFKGTQDEATEAELQVSKKAETIDFGDEDILTDLGWTNNDGSGPWSAYAAKEQDSTGWEQMYPDDEDEMKQKVYYKIDSAGTLEQTGEGQRAETNPTIKKMFLSNRYFKYDGSTETAEAITALRQSGTVTIDGGTSTADDPRYGAIDDSDENLSVSTTITDEKGNEKEVTVADVSGSVSFEQDSLNEFSMLENTHTLDADYIYRDFKELVVELGYYTKEELTDETPELLEFPIPDIGSYEYPNRSLDKRENEYGTMIHSKGDLDANVKNTLVAAIQAAFDEDANGDLQDVDNDSQETSSFSEKIKSLGIDTSDGPVTLTVSGSTKHQNSGTKSNGLLSLEEWWEECDNMMSTFASEHWSYEMDHTYTSFEKAVAAGAHHVDCSLFASWALQKLGVLSDTQTFSSHIADNKDVNGESADVAQAIMDAGAEIIVIDGTIGSEDKLEPGDVVFFDDNVGHVTIYYGEGPICYDAGSDYWNSKDEPISYDSVLTRHCTIIVRFPFGNSKSNEGDPYEGYLGNEAVVSPVTGLLLEYGTVERTNIDLKYGFPNSDIVDDEESTDPADPTEETGRILKEEVGFAKILVLDYDVYQQFESQMWSSTSSNFKDNTGTSGSFLKDNGTFDTKNIEFEENSDEKTVLKGSDVTLDDLTNIDNTLYGYKEFAELYYKYGIAGYIVYMEGFKCELPDDEYINDPDAEGYDETATPQGTPLEKSSFKEITLSNLNDDDTEYEYIQTKYEADEEYKTASKKATLKLNAETTIKDAASPSISLSTKIKIKEKQSDKDGNVTVTENSYDAIFIKEGTVLGRTFTDRELVEQRNESEYPYTYYRPDNTSDDENKDQLIGNYIRIVLTDLDKTTVEDVETYMKLDNGDNTESDTDIEWELWYFSPFEGTGWDAGYGWEGDESGPEAVKNNFSHRSTYKGGGYNYDVGIIQWTTNVSFNIISKFCKAAAAYNPSLCGTLTQYVDKDYSWYDNQANMNQLQNSFTEICNKDRDGFLQVQINLAKWGASGERDGDRGDLTAYLGICFDKYPWLEDRRLVVQGSVMSAAVATGNVPTLSESMSDETIIETAVNALAGDLSPRKTKQIKVAKDILHNNYSESELETWVRTMTPPSGTTGWE